jgi:hypothetical protein
MKNHAVLAVLTTFVCQVASAQAPSNAVCANAIPIFDGINPGAPNGTEGFTFSNAGTAPVGGIGTVWFSYTATATAFTTLATCTPAGFAPASQSGGLTLYDACGGVVLTSAFTVNSCGPNLASGGAAAAKASLGAPLTAGQTYYLAVLSAAASEGTFYLTVAAQQAQPAEACGGALPALVAPATTVDLTGMAPPVGPSPCFLSGAVSDGWLSVVPATSGVLSVRASTVRSGAGFASSSFPIRVALFDAAGGCGSAPLVACESAGTLQASVVAGNLYALQVTCGNWISGPERVLVTSAVTAPEAGDNCASAPPLMFGVNPVNQLRVSGETWTQAACPGSTSAVDVWRSLVVASDCVVSYSVGGGTLSSLQIFAGPCGSLSAVTCGAYQTFLASAGVQYSFRLPFPVGHDVASGVLILACQPPAVNDECVNAAPVGLGTTPFSVVGSTPNPSTAPASISNCSLASSANQRDVWFAFTAPSAGGYVVRAPIMPSGFSMQAIDGCGGPVLDCAWVATTLNGDTAYASFVASAGHTVLVRVAGGSNSDGSAPPMALDIQSAPSNDDVDGAVELSPGLNPSPPNGQDGVMFSTVGASDDGVFASFGTCPLQLPTVPIPSGRPEVWFKYTPDFTGRAVVTLCPPTGFVPPPASDPRMYVFNGYPLPDRSNVLSCSENYCGLWPRADFFSTAGQTYYIEVEEGPYAGSGTASYYVRADYAAVDEVYGAPCGDTAAVLVATDPLVDSTSIVAIMQAYVYGTTAFLYGSADAGVPFSLVGPVPNCNVILDISTLFPLGVTPMPGGPPSAAAANLVISYPPIQPNLAGASFRMQALLLPGPSSPASTPPYVLTNGLRMQVGY